MKNKKSGNVFLISSIVISAFLAFLLAIMFLFPFLSVRSKLNDVAEQFDEIDSEDIITVSDPLYKEDIVARGVTVILEENDADIVSKQVSHFIDKAKYSKTAEDIAGCWDVEIALRTNDGVYKIYFTEDYFYVAKGIKKYVFEVSASECQAYDDFYSHLEEIIAKG